MIRALLVTLLVALAAPAAAFAATCPRTSVADLEDELMCQVCGVPLGWATGSPQADRERAFVASLVARCESKQQIKTEMVAQYGKSVLAEPPHGGFDLTAYLVPAIAVGFAATMLGWLALAWRRRRRADGGAQPAAPVLSAPDRALVDAALDRWEP